jgi:hypothetical protein
MGQLRGVTMYEKKMVTYKYYMVMRRNCIAYSMVEPPMVLLWGMGSRWYCVAAISEIPIMGSLVVAPMVLLRITRSESLLR